MDVSQGGPDCIQFNGRSHIVVGRSSQCDISLPAASLTCSRQYAAIASRRFGSQHAGSGSGREDSEAVYVQDLQSTHVTYVRGSKIHSHEWTEMSVGDYVTFGDETAAKDASVADRLHRELKKRKSPEERDVDNAIAIIVAMEAKTRAHQSTVPDKSRRGNSNKGDRRPRKDWE